MKYKGIKKIIFFVFLLCCINTCVFALDYDDHGVPGAGLNPPAGGGGGSGDCETRGWCGPTGDPYPGGFRFTLVDEQGNIVPGTHSVDITGSESFYNAASNYHYINNVVAFKDAASNDVSSRYFHKYGIKFVDGRIVADSNTNIITDSNPKNNLIYLEGTFADYNFAPSDPNPSSPTSVEQFKQYILGGETFRRWTVPNVLGSTTVNVPVTFFEYFLNKCGFFDEEGKVTLSQYPEKHAQLFDNEDGHSYYLIIEPLYEVWTTIRTNAGGYGQWNVYGTVSEFAYHLYTQTNSSGVHGASIGMSTEIYNVSSYMCTKGTDGVRLFSGNGVDTNNGLCIAKQCPGLRSGQDFGFCTQNVWNYKDGERLNYYTANPEWGYGVYTIAVSDMGIPIPPRDEYYENPVNIKLDLCQSNDGIIGIHPSFTTSLEPLLDSYEGRNPENAFGEFYDANFGTEFFKVQGTGDQTVYCYDDVTYNFSNFMANANGEQRVHGSLKFFAPALGVTRRCIHKTGISVGYDVKSKTIEDYSKTIKADIYGHAYEFFPRFDNARDIYITVNPTETIELSKGQYTLETVNIKTYYYVSKIDGVVQNARPARNEWITVSIENSTQPRSGCLIFGNQLSGSNDQNALQVFQNFGASNRILKYLSNIGDQRQNIERTATKNGVNMHYTNKYFVTYSDGGIDTDHLVCNYQSTFIDYEYDNYLRFRTISLNNPFPARDGSARLPAENWLSDDKSKVYDYISSNRGVRYYNKNASAEELYTSDNIEPMYTVVLTPSNMVKIREYNKTHQYDSMYSEKTLQCNSNDRECFSTFLRTLGYFSSDTLSGSCVLTDSSDTTIIRNTLNNYDTLPNTVSENNANYFRENIGYSVRNPYDLNKNGRIDTQDSEIYVDYYDKINHGEKPSNSKFYTCANKSYFSGGPVGGER